MHISGIMAVQISLTTKKSLTFPSLCAFCLTLAQLHNIQVCGNPEYIHIYFTSDRGLWQSNQFLFQLVNDSGSTDFTKFTWLLLCMLELWPCFLHSPYTWWIFVSSLSDITPVSTQILCHMKKGVNTSKTDRRWLSCCQKRELHLTMTFTFDLWPWKPFQQCSLTLGIFLASIAHIPPMSMKISLCTPRIKCYK